jgi:hypothetical protein
MTFKIFIIIIMREAQCQTRDLHTKFCFKMSGFFLFVSLNVLNALKIFGSVIRFNVFLNEAIKKKYIRMEYLST